MKQSLKKSPMVDQSGQIINRIWFDTEFIADQPGLPLISIGMVRDDGEEFYAVSSEFDVEQCGRWLRWHVLRQLGPTAPRPRSEIAEALIAWVPTPCLFYGWYCAQDWVVLSSLFGGFMKLPHGWPHIAHDIETIRMHVGVPDTVLPKNHHPHHALEDARWTRSAHLAIERALGGRRRR